LATKVVSACLVIEGNRDQTASLETLDPRAKKDLLGRRELRGPTDSPVNKVQLATWVQWAQVEPMDRMEFQELLDLRVQLEPLVLRDRRVDQDRWVHRDQLVP
jgi:hypothetical protein